jgi:hypothetical protein
MKTKNASLCITCFVFLYLSAHGLLNNAEAKTLNNGYFAKSSTLIRICLGYIRLKNYNKAEKALDSGYKIAQKMDESFSRNILLNEVTDKYILLAKYEKALKAAKGLEFQDVRSAASSKIAYHYVEIGDYKKTIDLIKQIKDPLLKAMLLYKIVNRLNDLELYDESIEILADTMDSPYLTEKLVIVQSLERKMLKRNREISYVPEVNPLLSPEQKYSEAGRLALIAKKYFALKLYQPAREVLFRAGLISREITDEKQNNILEEEIRDFSARLYDFERALISNTLKKNFSK